MQAIDNLSTHLKKLLVDLEKAKEEGRRIIGYTPGGYLPEELVLASGAIPIGLIRGGDHSVVELAGLIAKTRENRDIMEHMNPAMFDVLYVI